jgi:hypothetical protein
VETHSPTTRARRNNPSPMNVDLLNKYVEDVTSDVQKADRLAALGARAIVYRDEGAVTEILKAVDGDEGLTLSLLEAAAAIKDDLTPNPPRKLPKPHHSETQTRRPSGKFSIWQHGGAVIDRLR